MAMAIPFSKLMVKVMLMMLMSMVRPVYQGVGEGEVDEVKIMANPLTKTLVKLLSMSSKSVAKPLVKC